MVEKVKLKIKKNEWLLRAEKKSRKRSEKLRKIH